MKVKIKEFIKNNILLVFAFLVLFLLVAGIIYYFGLNPSEKSIFKIINKYKTKDYELPVYVADRYLTWYNMRTYFFV